MKIKIRRYRMLGLFLLLGLTACYKVDTSTVEEDIGETGQVQLAEEVPVNQQKLSEQGIEFSKTAHFYKETIEVEILSNKSGKIYYTTDGSDPGPDKTLYEGAIKLKAENKEKVTVLKAKAFFDDGTESATIVHSYFMGEYIDKRYDTLVFSVTTDPYNLYDYEYGIFVEGKLRDDFKKENPYKEIVPSDPANYNMRGREAEREVYLEIFEPEGTLIAGQPAGIRTYGGWSRANKQKSIKLFARKEYSEVHNKFRYEFFPNKTAADGSGDRLDTFKQLVLRNSGNDNGFAFIRDELFQTLAGQAGYMDYQAVRPAALYVNGDYRGFFWLHEVYCDEYFEDHYGKHDGEFIILEGGEKFKDRDEDGENARAVDDYEKMYEYANLDLTDDTNYQKLGELMDIENYLSYYALQIYIGNEDWPHNNYKTYRYYAAEGEAYREAPFDGKWRYLLHDLDYSFGIYKEGTVTDNIRTYIGKEGEITEASPMFGALMQRDDCKEFFIKKTLDLLNGAFSPENINQVLDEMNASRLNELKHTYGKNLLEDWVNYEQLEWRLEHIRSYGKKRADRILNRYQEWFKLGDMYRLSVQPADGSSIKINSYKTDKAFEGTYYTDYNTVINATLPEGVAFLHWVVNGKTIEDKELIITSDMIKDGSVEVTLVLK